MNKNNRITIEGTIYFDPDNWTAKHESQASWKKVAMVFIEGGISDYYSWFIKKRFDIELTKPLRGAHISFINDGINEMTAHAKTNDERKVLWEKVKKKYHKKKIKIVLDVRPHTSTKSHWWLIIPHDERGDLQAIRDELGFVNKKTGLSKPFFGMHMTIGHAVDKRPEPIGIGESADVISNVVTAKKMNVAQSEYIIRLIRDGRIKFDN